MTLEEQKRLALLAALLHVGGRATKAHALNVVHTLSLLNLTARDMAFVQYRKEERWRNDLAYIRKHLVADGLLSSGGYDNWQVTLSGRQYAEQLAGTAQSETSASYVKTDLAAEVIRKALGPPADDAAADAVETIGFEGGSRKVWSTRYERDLRLRAEAIRIHGDRCMGCDFHFGEVYGEAGEGYIEVHHLSPVSTIDAQSEVNPKEDLIVLCSNCHSVVHRRKRTPLTLRELRSAVTPPNNSSQRR